MGILFMGLAFTLTSFTCTVAFVGFLLGGVRVYGGDPGPGIALLPIGALCLLVAVWSVAREMSR